MTEKDKINDAKNNIIDHKLVVELLSITMLIYDYGKLIKEVDKNETVDTFINQFTNINVLDNCELSDTRKNVLISIAKNAPSGKMYSFISDKDTDLQAGITLNRKHKRICVVFRGSESSNDWFYDLQVRKHNLKDNIWVHSGFYKQLFDNGSYAKILQELTTLIEENPDHTIYITGHSLGAALATLFGYLLSHELKHQITIVSFASPRVGNTEWQKSFQSKSNLKHYRITNSRDIVTAFPLYKYKHVGHDIRIFENTHSIFMNYSDTSSYDYTIFRCWSANDHDCELYYKRLIKNVW